MAKNEKLVSNDTKEVKRFYKGQTEIDHDLFKLKSADMKKNVSYKKNSPEYVTVEHCHFFHTYDSSGKKLSNSNSVGGHYHKVTVEEIDGRLVAKCSPPLQNEGGVDVPVRGDFHIHEVEYIRSERVQVRKMNDRATQFISEYMSEVKE